MTVIDYPDYQAYGNQQSPNLLSTYRPTFKVGTTQLGWYSVPQWRCINLVINQLDQPAYVTVYFTSAFGGGYSVQQYEWGLNATSGLDVTIPCKTPWFYITVINYGTASATPTCSLIGTNNGSGELLYPVQSTLIAQRNKSVAAATSIYKFAPFIYKGRAHLHFEPADATSSLGIWVQAFDYAGGVTADLTHFNKPSGIQDRDIVVPDQLIGVQIYNYDSSSAHSCTYSLSAA